MKFGLLYKEGSTLYSIFCHVLQYKITNGFVEYYRWHIKSVNTKAMIIGNLVLFWVHIFVSSYSTFTEAKKKILFQKCLMNVYSYLSVWTFVFISLTFWKAVMRQSSENDFLWASCTAVLRNNYKECIQSARIECPNFGGLQNTCIFIYSRVHIKYSRWFVAVQNIKFNWNKF